MVVYNHSQGSQDPTISCSPGPGLPAPLRAFFSLHPRPRLGSATRWLAGRAGLLSGGQLPRGLGPTGRPGGRALFTCTADAYSMPGMGTPAQAQLWSLCPWPLVSAAAVNEGSADLREGGCPGRGCVGLKTRASRRRCPRWGPSLHIQFEGGCSFCLIFSPAEAHR